MEAFLIHFQKNLLQKYTDQYINLRKLESATDI